MSSRRSDADVSSPEDLVSVHAYPPRAAAMAAARAVTGIVVAAAAWAFLGTGWLAAAVALAIAALFAGYGLRAIRRLRVPLILTETTLRTENHGGGCVHLDQLKSLRLAYYSTRRDGENGWMELRLGDGKSAFTVESEISGFSRIVAAVASAARQAGVKLSSATERNISILLDGPPSSVRHTGGYGRMGEAQ